MTGDEHLGLGVEQEGPGYSLFAGDFLAELLEFVLRGDGGFWLGEGWFWNAFANWRGHGRWYDNSSFNRLLLR